MYKYIQQMPNDVNNIHVGTVISRVSHSFRRLKTFKNLTEQDICEPMLISDTCIDVNTHNKKVDI